MGSTLKERHGGARIARSDDPQAKKDDRAMTASAALPVIPRAKLFGNPTRAQARISPDGRWLSWLAPRDGVLNIWLAPLDDIDAARAITDDRKRGIRFYAWAYDGVHLLYMQDEGGTEDWHIYAVAVETGAGARPDAHCRCQRPHRPAAARYAERRCRRHQRSRQGLARSLSRRHCHWRARAAVRQSRRALQHRAGPAIAPQARHPVARSGRWVAPCSASRGRSSSRSASSSTRTI